jgi:hypothetical protein
VQARPHRAAETRGDDQVSIIMDEQKRAAHLPDRDQVAPG